MLSEAELKELLKQFQEANYAVPKGFDIYTLSFNMMHYIGVSDLELRDKLIYRLFSRWFMNKCFTAEQMKALIKISLDQNHLFYRIGEKGTDSVFTRSFSILILPLALNLDHREHFLDKQEVMDIKDKVLQYAKQEKDFRGYVDGKGWADARSHLADILDELALSASMEREGLMEILSAIKEILSTGDCPCICEEDERLVTAFMSIYQRNLLNPQELAEWLNGFRQIEKSGVTPNDLYRKMNHKSFLRSLYFRLMYVSESKLLIETIQFILKDIYSF